MRPCDAPPRHTPDLIMGGSCTVHPSTTDPAVQLPTDRSLPPNTHPTEPRQMQTINRFLYGPTPEERIRAWQAKLRAEQRQLDREMRQVRRPPPLRAAH